MSGTRGKSTVRLAGVVLVAAVALGTLLASAAAKKPRFESTISIHTRFEDGGSLTPFVYSGRVRSEKRGCVRHRTVVLKNEASPVPYEGASDTTNDEGRWRIALQGDLLEGDYYAKVKRREKRRYVCRGARSEAVPAPSPPG
jgi:hypothetical protein